MAEGVGDRKPEDQFVRSIHDLYGVVARMLAARREYGADVSGRAECLTIGGLHVRKVEPEFVAAQLLARTPDVKEKARHDTPFIRRACRTRAIMIRPRGTCLSGWDNRLAFLTQALWVPASRNGSPVDGRVRRSAAIQNPGMEKQPGQGTTSSVSQTANGKSQGIKHATVRFID